MVGPKPKPAEERHCFLGVSVPPEMWAWIEAQRQKEGVKRSHLIVAALAAYRQQKEA